MLVSKSWAKHAVSILWRKPVINMTDALRTLATYLSEEKSTFLYSSFIRSFDVPKAIRGSISDEDILPALLHCRHVSLGPSRRINSYQVIPFKCFDLSSAYHPPQFWQVPRKTHTHSHEAGCAQLNEPLALPTAQLSLKYPPVVLNLSAFTPMSHTQPVVASSSNYQLIINNALDTYKKRTKKDLITHPLAASLQACDTPAAILTIIREQIDGLEQSRSNGERWSKWLDPTVNVLFAFSTTIGAGVGLVCLRTCTHPISVFSYPFSRHFLPRV